MPMAACGSEPSPGFAELIADPARYNGRDIAVEGFYFSGFEIAALAGSLAPASRPGNVMPVQPLIWIKTTVSVDPESRLCLQQNTPSGYDEHYGKVRLEGRFEYGGTYGHMNAYSYQLVVTRAEVLPWTAAAAT